MADREQCGPRGEHRNVHVDACDGATCPCFTEGYQAGFNDGELSGKEALHRLADLANRLMPDGRE